MIRLIWEKMMKWGWDYNRNLRDNYRHDIVEVESSNERLDMERALRFNVLPCQGGVVMECRTFDPKNHTNSTRTFIIHENDNLAERIGQIVSMEILRS